jgi:predicted ATPase
VWAVLLAAAPAGSDIAPLVARSRGVAAVGGEVVQETIASFLRHKHLLLLLDNCEHVLPSVAALTDTLLRDCPRVHVLATSRQPLGIDGEHVWALPSLTLPSQPGAEGVLASAAGQLFTQRAASAGAHFPLTDDAADDVAAVCKALDGLPLALELAAATSRSVPLGTLRERLESGTAGLRSTNPMHQERQRTVEDLIGWSYRLLDDVQAAVFRRLAVFRGGWTLAAAEQVCQGGAVLPDDVLRAHADLADRSLISLESEDRYRMLVLISAFARQQAGPPGERDQAAEAHLTWFASLADRAAFNSPAGLQLISLHECRHTFASLMIAAGVNLKALQVFMGHASITVTLDLYGHLMPGSELEATRLADAYLDREIDGRRKRSWGTTGEQLTLDERS